MEYFKINEAELAKKGATYTAKEIYEQPEVWGKTFEKLQQEQKQATEFWSKAIKKCEKIILTGAGTSAYIGYSLEGAFQRHTGITTVSIPTTHIVTHPTDYLQPDVVTLMISFAGSTHAMSVITPSSGTSFQRRLTTNATSSHTTIASITAPYWVRVVRSGNTFTGYYSSNGSTWTSQGSVTISMSSSVYVGLVTTSHSDGVLCSASIDNVTVTTSTTIPVTGVSLSPTTSSLTVGATQQLTATIAPTTASVKTVTWSSSNTAVATVSSTGLVTAIAAGSATITVTTTDGSKTATCGVTVSAAVLSNLALNKTVTASSQQSTNPVSNLVDGNADSRWSAQVYPQWAMVDLGAIYTISSTEVICYGDRAYQFIIEAATTSGGTYTKIVDRSTNTTGGSNTAPITNSFTSIDARYVRITVSGASGYTGDWTSIEELRVFGYASSMKSAIGSESFAQQTIETNMLVYPNPAQNILNFELQNIVSATQLELYTSTGQLIKIQSIEDINGSIDISELSNGMYFIKINGTSPTVKRFIKE
jgi:hypothetical protein